MKEQQRIRKQVISKDITDTSTFLVPAFLLSKEELERHGFVNGYIKDALQEFNSDDILIYFLFKPENGRAFEIFNEKLEEKRLIHYSYDYEGGYVVLILKFPEQWREDFNKVVAGKYSKVSDEYKNLFPIYIERWNNDLYMFEQVTTVQYGVFNKTEALREYVEEQLEINIDDMGDDFEYHRAFNIERETLYIDKINKKDD